MKRTIITGILLALAAGAAGAADLPALITKAPITPATLWDTGGLYVGLESGAAVANTSTSALGLNSLVSGNVKSDGGYIGGVVGYMKGSAAHWYAGECDASYRNISSGDVTAVMPGGSTIGVASVASRWSAGCEARVGGSVDPMTLLANAAGNIGLGSISFPTFNPVPPPGAHVAAAPRTYIGAGFEAFGVSGNFGGVGGADVVWAPRVRIGALWQQLNSAGTPTGGVFDVSGKIVLAKNGLEFSNVFDPAAGAKFTGTTTMGNLYAVELRYMFSPGGITLASK
jgi:hypothetical protein